MRQLIAFIPLLLISISSNAAPVTLSCTLESGQPAADLIVDITARQMQWSVYRFRITTVTDRYITANQEQQNDVGGEIWVQDRVTGHFMRGGVSIEASGVDKAGQLINPRLVPSTSTGYCKTPML